MTVLQQYGTSDTSTEAEKIKQYIASMPLLDIGIIRKIDGNIADIQLCSNASIYPLELIDCGSGDATLLPAFAGQYCLVLNVTTPLNITDGTTDLSSGLNNIAKAKALPIGAARAADVNMTVRKDGIVLGSTEYSLSFLKEKLQAIYGTCAVSFDGDGLRIGNQNFGLCLLNEQFKYVSNATYDEKTGEMKTAGSITTVDNSTGDIQIQTGVDADNDKILSTVDIKNDGSIAIHSEDSDNATSATVNMATDGSIVLTTLDDNNSKSATISMNNEGAISITSEGDKTVKLSILSDGSVSVECDTVSLKAESGLTFDGDVTITGSLNVADGNFTVDK